ncbi:hypothetical protein QUC31_001667 [Theobroma cacao]
MKLLYPSLVCVDEYLLEVTLSEHDNDVSRRLMGVLKKLRESDCSYYQLSYLVRQGEQPREGLLLSY